MKYITKEEMEKQAWRGRGHSSKVYREVAGMDVGKILLIEPEDWGKRKYSPSAVVRYIEKKYKRKYHFLRHAGNQGWAVERVK